MSTANQTNPTHLEKFLPNVPLTELPNAPRYLSDGGFNAVFNIGENIIIGLVGRGFDSHELSQGLIAHERYTIPWSEALLIENRNELAKNGAVTKFRISADDYAKQRAERIAFLIEECHHNAAATEDHIPSQPRPVSPYLIDDLLENIILPLVEQQEQLSRDGLRQFSVKGYFVDGHAQPQELTRAKRWS